MENILNTWKNFVKYQKLAKQISKSVRKMLLIEGFKGIKACTIQTISMKKNIKNKYSIDHLNDYELSIKISILERKLSALHHNLLTEQITNKSLVSEKNDLIKIFN